MNGDGEVRGVGCACDGERALLSAPAVARMLDVSARQVWRLLAGGRIPRPVKIGRSVRWRSAELREWIADGCPKIQESA